MTTQHSVEPIWAIGLMTGTVLDGFIDVALIKTDGERVVEFGSYVLAPYPTQVREKLTACLRLAIQWQFSGPEPALFAEVEDELTRAQAAAVAQLLLDKGIAQEQIGIVGFHGQSVLHRAPTSDRKGQTRQLGNGQLMADLLGIPVVFDFRSKDMQAGGQGAPLAAVYHAALLRELYRAETLAEHCAVLNLGGIANLTWWDKTDTHLNRLVAFDTGPANAPINDWVNQHHQGNMDRNGELAAVGDTNEQRLSKLLQHPYFSKAYPKSLDRFDFSSSMADGFNLNDGAALLTAFSASAVALALDMLPIRPERLIVCGGGRHNPTLMREIEQRASVVVSLADQVGWRGDAIEAECFAFLAVRVLRGLPISYPSTTGAKKAIIGGEIARPCT